MSTQINKYKIVRTVGKGGMGEVYLAKHPTLNKNVVIKQLKIRKTKRNIELFKNEAANLFHFQNEHIINFYDHFEKGGNYYLVIEYVEGLDLAALIETEPLPLSEAMLIFYHALIGLRYAHAKNTIHRDIKPGNILISRDGEVKIADFGISTTEKIEGREASKLIGTPGYIAPELFKSAANASPSTDIYALGIVLYMMLTRRRPYPNDLSPETIKKISKGQRKPIWGLPFWVSHILRKSLHHKPYKRFQSCNEVITLIEKKLKVPDRDRQKNVIKHLVLNRDPDAAPDTLEKTLIHKNDKTILKGSQKKKGGKKTFSSNPLKIFDPFLIFFKDFFSKYSLDENIFKMITRRQKHFFFTIAVTALFIIIFYAVMPVLTGFYADKEIFSLQGLKKNQRRTIPIEILLPPQAASKDVKWHFKYYVFPKNYNEIKNLFISNRQLTYKGIYRFEPLKADQNERRDFTFFYGKLIRNHFENKYNSMYRNIPFAPHNAYDRFLYKSGRFFKNILLLLESIPFIGKKNFGVGPLVKKKSWKNLKNKDYILKKKLCITPGRLTILCHYDGILKSVTKSFLPDLSNESDEEDPKRKPDPIRLDFRRKSSLKSAEFYVVMKNEQDSFQILPASYGKPQNGEPFSVCTFFPERSGDYNLRYYIDFLSQSIITKREKPVYYFALRGETTYAKNNFRNMRYIPFPRWYLKFPSKNFFFITKK